MYCCFCIYFSTLVVIKALGVKALILATVTEIKRFQELACESIRMCLVWLFHKHAVSKLLPILLCHFLHTSGAI